jgi:hypothetical protein
MPCWCTSDGFDFFLHSQVKCILNTSQEYYGKGLNIIIKHWNTPQSGEVEGLKAGAPVLWSRELILCVC